MFSYFKKRHYQKYYHFIAQAYSKGVDSLSSQQIESIKSKAQAFDTAIQSEDFQECKTLKKELETFYEQNLKPTALNRSISFIFFFFGALFLALVIRQTIFELYEIPSGSMRPNYLEKDRLLVSKTTFGLNIPFQTGHIWSEDSQVQRGLPVVWTGDQIPLPDVDTTFLGIPHKKRFIKRIIGLPGDLIYFAHGTILGLDKDGNPIDLTDTALDNLPILPIIRFEGNPANATLSIPQILFNHFGLTTAAVSLTNNQTQSNLITSDWSNPQKPIFAPEDFFSSNPNYWGQLGGLENYALAQLSEDSQGNAALELFHHPSIRAPLPLYQTTFGITAQMQPFKSVLELNEAHIERIKDALHTSRFDVIDNTAYKWGMPKENQIGIVLSQCPDGTYEFINGIAYQITSSGRRSHLPKDHPIYPSSFKDLITLFNSGVNWQPISNHTTLQYKTYSGRLAYYSPTEDLSLFHQPIIDANDREMISFLENEKLQLEAQAKPAFLPPVSIYDNDKISTEYLDRWGLKVPEGHILVLGDHSANSLDSRYFGFLPLDNIRGTPSFIFWPPSRIQFFSLNPTTWSMSTLIVWAALVPIIAALWYWKKTIRDKQVSLLKK